MVYNCMTSKVRNARLQLAENVLNELSPMLLRRARNKAMGTARVDRNISKNLAYDARHGDNRDRIVKGAVSDDFANTAEKRVGQAKKFNKGMVKRRKQLKAVVDEPNEPKKTDAPYEVPQYRTDQFADGTGKHWNRGKKPPMN